MPYVIKKTKSGYGLWNIDKKIWKSYNTTKKKAEAQMRLLEYIDYMKNVSGKKKYWKCPRMKIAMMSDASVKLSRRGVINWPIHGKSKGMTAHHAR